MPKKLSKTKLKNILKKIKDDSKLIPQVLDDLGITDIKPAEVRQQLVEEYGQEEFQKVMQTARQSAVPQLLKRVEQLLSNKGDDLTEDYCDKLADELEAAMEFVYLKKEELTD